MVFRIVGALAVMLGSVGLGLYYAAKEGFRVQDLSEFKKALLILSSEIEYMRSPLAVACANISKRTSLGAARLFEHFSAALTDGDGETAYQLWLASMEAVKDKSFLADEDWAVVEGFGKTLGYLDKQMQQNAITYAVSYIDEKTASLQIKADKNKKMYRSLGVIGGLMITVVLW